MNRQIGVLLLLLVFTGQSLAALLAPCLLPEIKLQHTPEIVMTPASQPATVTMGHHHEMAGHVMTASATPAMDMDRQMPPAMSTGNDPAASAHMDHNCCHGLCACLAMGCFSHAATASTDIFIANASPFLPAYPAEPNATPFLSPALRPPISLA